VSSDLRVIEDCFVTASSGCHRYDYWNEQALFDGRPDTGWSTPSRTASRDEYLEIDLGEIRTPSRIRLQARPIEDWPGFPRALGVLARSANEWVPMLEAKDITTPGGDWWEGELDPIDTQWLRIEIDDVGWRANDTYFLQFMQLQILEGVDR
jgi:F5/8 type C domain